MKALSHMVSRLVFAVAPLIMVGCETPLAQRVQQGLDLTAQKNHAAAISHFDELIADEPDSPEAWNGRALARKAAGDLEGARSDYNQAIKLDSLGAYLFNNRATLLEMSRDHISALKDYDRAIQCDPHYDLALFNRACCKMKIPDYSGALSDFEALEQMGVEKKYDRYFYERGSALLNLDSFSRAEADYTEYLKRNPSGAQVADCLVLRGVNRINIGMHDSAYADLIRAEQKGLQTMDVYYYQAHALSEGGRCAEAIARYQKVLEMSPDMFRAMSSLGWCYEELGKTDKACELLTRAVELGETFDKDKINRLCAGR